MVIIPDSDIYLLKSPLQIDNKNQLTFTNATAQYNYFSSLTKLELEGATYQRKDGAIRFEGNFDDLVDYNYCMYKNTHYNNKWFYAYIIGMEYKNDNCTYVYIKTDVWQSWQFDIVYKPSFVEREMINVSADNPGANLMPESFETGEYKVQSITSVSNLEPVYVFCYSDKLIKIADSNGDIREVDLEHSVGSSIYLNGIPTTDIYYLCADTTIGAIHLQQAFIRENQGEKLVASFTVPKFAVNGITHSLQYATGTETITWHDLGVAHIFALSGNSTPATQTLSSTPTTLDGYIPKNAKLRQFPYMYLGYNPQNGTSKVYRYENFTNGTPSFKLISEINPNPTICFIPQNYRGNSGDSLTDNVSLNGYPQLASKVDVYNSWLAENTGIINVQSSQAATNRNLDIAANVTSLVGNVAGAGVAAATGGEGESSSGGAVTGIAGGVASSVVNIIRSNINYDYYIKNLNAQKERQALLPDNVSLGGSNATLLGYGLMDDNIFTVYTIKYQFAKRVDDYFSMYGYETNELKLPNINNRPNWNYVKLAGANLIGEIPETDLQEIKSLFNEGITLWHNSATFLDYSQNNRS